MRFPPDYAADYADTSAPIDLPDDFGADDAETDGDGVISWMAAAVLVVVAIIAAVLIFAVPA